MCTIQQHPGKFEGESCITHLMYAWAGDGALDYLDDVDYVCTVMQAVGPFILDDISDYQRNTNMGAENFCDECTKDFLDASRIHFWEDSNGFAYSEIL